MKIRRNIVLFNLFNLCSGLWLFSALAVIYFEQVTGSYVLAMLAFSMVNLVQSFSEVPCGIISDRVGRRQTVILSSIFLFINYILLAVAGSASLPWLLYIGSMCRGIGLAFQSGTTSAMIFETLADLRKRKIFDTVYARGAGYHQLGLVVSALAATFVTYYAPIMWVVWLSVVPSLGRIIVSWLLIEPKSNFDKDLTPTLQVKKSIQLLLKKKRLRSYTLLKIFDGALTVSVFRFETIYYQQLIPLYLINIVRMVQHSVGCVSFWLVPKIRKIGFLRLLYLSSFGMTIIRALGIFMNNALTPFFIATQNLFYGVGETSIETLLQQEYHKSLRATINSVSELLGGIVLAIVGCLIGILADLTSPRQALIFGIVFQFILSLIYRRLFYIYKK